MVELMDMNNNANPFLIANSDNPRLVLVSYPLTGENYGSWCRAMGLALTGRNKLGFAYGSIEEPLDEDPQHLAWSRNNSIVASWILNSVSKQIQASRVYSNSDFELWNDLHMLFHQNNGPPVFQIKKELFSCNQSSLNVVSYFI